MHRVCPKDHDHAPCAGKDTQASENYTAEMVDCIHRAFSSFCKVTSRIHPTSSVVTPCAMPCTSPNASLCLPKHMPHSALGSPACSAVTAATPSRLVALSSKLPSLSPFEMAAAWPTAVEAKAAAAAKKGPWGGAGAVAGTTTKAPGARGTGSGLAASMRLAPTPIVRPPAPPLPAGQGRMPHTASAGASASAAKRGDEDDIDPRARNVPVETASAAAAEEEPLEGEAGPVDWNAFKLLGSDTRYLKDADLARASEAERYARGVWHL